MENTPYGQGSVLNIDFDIPSVDYDSSIHSVESLEAIATEFSNLAKTDPAYVLAALQHYSTIIGDSTAGYNLEEMISVIQNGAISPEALGRIAGALDYANSGYQLYKIVKDGEISLEEAKALADLGYDKIADIILAGTPGINVIIHLPIIGQPIEFVLKEGGKLVGDTVGEGIDNLIGSIMDRTGGTDWLIRNKADIRRFFNDPTEFVLGDPKKLRIQLEDYLTPKAKRINEKAQFFFKTLNECKE